MDLDGDGYLSMYELEYFYEEQLQRMEALGIEALPFEDCLCWVSLGRGDSKTASRTDSRGGGRPEPGHIIVAGKAAGDNHCSVPPGRLPESEFESESEPESVCV